MAKIQSKINKPFTKELLYKFFDDVSDLADEQHSMEAGEVGMHAQSKDNYTDAAYEIQSLVEEYCEDLDLFSILDFELDSNGNFVFEEYIIDMASGYKDLVENYLAEEKLKMMPNTNFINNFSILLAKKCKDYKINTEGDINNEKDYNKLIFQTLISANIEKIKKNFNQETLNKNSLYKKIANLIKTEMLNEFENFYKECENVDKFHYRFKYNNKEFEIAERANKTIETYKKYINLIKNKNKLSKDDPNFFDIHEAKSIEEIDDALSKMIEKSKLEKYVKRFIGSYKTLLNDESMDIFSEIKRLRIDDKIIRYHLSKIYLMENSEVLNSALTKAINHNKESFDDIKMKIYENNLNAIVLHEDKNNMVVGVLDIKASNEISSSSWCISHSSGYFDQYSADNYMNVSCYTNKVPSFNPLSHIGITVNSEGHIKHAFDKKNKSLINSIGNILDKNLIRKISTGIKLKSVKKYLKNIESKGVVVDINDLNYSVLAINELDKRLIGYKNIEKFDTDKAINEFVSFTQKENIFNETEINKEITKFKSIVERFKEKNAIDDKKIEDFINNKNSQKENSLNFSNKNNKLKV